MTIGLPVKFFIIAYLFLIVVLVVVSIPVVPVMLLITYLRDGTLEIPGATQNE